MSLIILTTLGTGEYHPATYQWGERPVVQTPLVSAALQQWFPEAQVKVLLTPKAAEKNGALLRDLLPGHEPLPIANGETEADNWQLFETVAQAIPEGAAVVFDITHGFRSLPVLTLLALSYLRIVKRVQLQAVVYGAFQAGQDTTPVFDLTPFVTLLDWAQAANRFAGTGDASLFRPLLAMQQKADYNAVSRQLETLSQAIFGNRGRAVPQEANKLLRVLDTAQGGRLEQHQQPFALVMKELQEQVRPLSHANKDDRLKLHAEYALIRWYADRGHYPQALSLAREWLISVRQWHQQGRISMAETEREEINTDVWQAINALAAQGDHTASFPDLPPELHAYANATSQVAKRRNDFMHFGFKDDALAVTQVRTQAEKALATLPAAAMPLGLEL